MKDISKLFETIMDFKGLSCLITEKSLIKNQRPVFFFAIVSQSLKNFHSETYTKFAHFAIFKSVSGKDIQSPMPIFLSMIAPSNNTR